jgi:hypothetical protein
LISNNADDYHLDARICCIAYRLDQRIVFGIKVKRKCTIDYSSVDMNSKIDLYINKAVTTLTIVSTPCKHHHTVTPWYRRHLVYSARRNCSDCNRWEMRDPLRDRAHQSIDVSMLRVVHWNNTYTQWYFKWEVFLGLISSFVIRVRH